jgi:hypothetical protein
VEEYSALGVRLQKRRQSALSISHLRASDIALSDEDAAFVEFKLALSKTLQALRAAQELSQIGVAKRLQSSQSRVAKMEASDPSVSVDLLVKSLFRLGAQPCDIAKAPRPRRKVSAV